MRLLPRLAVLTLILVSTSGTASNPGIAGTPIAAKSMQACTGSHGYDPAVASARPGIRCLSGADPVPTQQGRYAIAPCSAASTYDNNNLVDLHRSIRDGGLGVLRPPAHGYGANPIAANRSDPASCGAG
jgi:hypothetical protein